MYELLIHRCCDVEGGELSEWAVTVWKKGEDTDEKPFVTTDCSVSCLASHTYSYWGPNESGALEIERNVTGCWDQVFPLKLCHPLSSKNLKDGMPDW